MCAYAARRTACSSIRKGASHRWAKPLNPSIASAVVGIRERAVGSVLGLAIGDALGAPFEFSRAKDVPSPLPAFQLSWNGMAPGTWTDDTAMARNLWRSLTERGRLDLDDVLQRHLAWLTTSPPDVGNMTRLVLTWAGKAVADAARRYVEERGPEV